MAVLLILLSCFFLFSLAEFNDPSSWLSYDAGQTSSMITVGYRGAVFDNSRYIYFSPFFDDPAPHGKVLRYDTQGRFTNSSSWTAYDASNTDSMQTVGYSEGVLVDDFVYFAPFFYLTTTTFHSRILRYHTSGNFVQSSSWTAFDIEPLFPIEAGSRGICSDGRYVYLAPVDGNRFPRYDTNADFYSNSSWEISYDGGWYLGSGYEDCIVVNGFVFWNPYCLSGNSCSIVRYHTSGLYDAASSFSSRVSLLTDGMSSLGYFGLSTDGRYVYFTPYHHDGAKHGRFLRYDTLNDFDQSESWEAYDASDTDSVDCVGFVAGAFDGSKYMYFLQHRNSASAFASGILRYDTTASFKDPASWEAHTLPLIVKGSYDIVFAYGYMYTVPYYNTDHNGVVLRYDLSDSSTISIASSDVATTEMTTARTASSEVTYTTTVPTSTTVQTTTVPTSTTAQTTTVPTSTTAQTTTVPTSTTAQTTTVATSTTAQTTTVPTSVTAQTTTVPTSTTARTATVPTSTTAQTTTMPTSTTAQTTSFHESTNTGSISTTSDFLLSSKDDIKSIIVGVTVGVVGILIALAVIILAIACFLKSRRRYAPIDIPLVDISSGSGSSFFDKSTSPASFCSSTEETKCSLLSKEVVPEEFPLVLPASCQFEPFPAPVEGKTFSTITISNDTADTCYVKACGDSTKKYTLHFLNEEEFSLKAGCSTDLTIELVMSCTTTLDLKIPVIAGSCKRCTLTADAVHTFLFAHVTSVLSIRLDYDEFERFPAPLGEGSFGVVWRATWRHQDVAVKMLKQQYLTFDDLTSFVKEMELMETLKCPVVVQFIGVCLFPGSLSIVTEYVALGSVEKVMKSNTFSYLLKLRIAQDCAKGLSFLHSNLLMHRDMKLDNLLMTSMNPEVEVVCKISDFGSSRYLGAATMTKGVGTPIYMAPELLEYDHGTKYTTSADVFSYAILLYILITEKINPYSVDVFDTSWRVANFIIKGNRLEIPKTCPNGYAQLIRDCWYPSPEQRPTSSDVFLCVSRLVNKEVQH